MAEDYDEYFDKHPIYDLRQIYAKDLLGDTLKKVKLWRETKAYSQWFDSVRWDLYADLFQKLDKDEIELLDKLIEETETIISQHPNAYLKKTNDANEHRIIMKAIWTLEVTMKNLFEEHAIYGRQEDEEGL